MVDVMTTCSWFFESRRFKPGRMPLSVDCLSSTRWKFSMTSRGWVIFSRFSVTCLKRSSISPL